MQRHTYLAWFYHEGLETIDPIHGFNEQHHGSENAMDWGPFKMYAPNGEVVDLEDPPEDLSPEPDAMLPELVPEPMPKPLDLDLEKQFKEEEPMKSKPEKELIEIDSDTEPEYVGSDSN